MLKSRCLCSILVLTGCVNINENTFHDNKNRTTTMRLLMLGEWCGEKKV